MRVLERNEFADVKGKRVMVDEVLVLSNDLVVVAGFREKEEMVLKATVGCDFDACTFWGEGGSHVFRFYFWGCFVFKIKSTC